MNGRGSPLMHGGRKSPLSTEVARATTYQPLSDDSRDHTNAIANSTSTALGVRLMGQCEVVNGAAAAVHVHAHAHFNDADDEDDEDWEFFQATGPQTRFPTTSTAQPPHAPTPPSKSREKRKLTIAIALCTLFFLIELVGGFLASSLAVLNDAFHLLSDLLSFVISLSAIYISTWAATRRHTFGFHRIQAIGVFFSILLIYIVTVALVWEAVDRLHNPVTVNGTLMFGVALAGVVINLILGFTLHDFGHHPGGHSHVHGDDTEAAHGHDHGHHHHHHHGHGHGHSHDINIRAAMLHIIGDLISSVGVLIASIIIMVEDLTYVQLDPTSRTNRYLIADPICTFVFAVLVVFTTLPLMRECYHVLMESAPSHIDTEAMIEVIVDDVPGVVDVHELRVWSLSMGVTAVIVGVVVNVRGTGDKAVRASLDEATLPMVLSPSAHNDLVTTVQYLLWRRYRIRREHSWVTVQYR